MNPERKLSPLSVSHLCAAYERAEVVSDVSFTLSPQTLTALVGPNGAGKSTLLKAVLGLHPVSSGRVLFWGEPLASRRRDIAYVPQRNAVDWTFPATSLDVVLMGLYAEIGWFRWPKRRHRERALATLDEVGMAEFATRPIGDLSGGQQQRVFLARALVQKAELLVLDEPFTGIDATTQDVILTLLRHHRDKGGAVICVHHDLETVPLWFDQVFFLNRKRISHGSIGEVFTQENIRKTYGLPVSLKERPAKASEGLPLTMTVFI
jgi:manganese/zinc/iron transport system ATP- binding protein